MLFKRARVSSLVVPIAMLLIAMPALAATVELLPIKDNTLYEPIQQDDFEDRSNALGNSMFIGKVKDADADPGPGERIAVRRAVLAFDIAGNIPAGATVDSVQLTLVATKTIALSALSGGM